MNNKQLRWLALGLIGFGLIATYWFDQTNILFSPLIWFTHAGVVMALYLLAKMSTRRLIFPLVIWSIAYIYPWLLLYSFQLHLSGSFLFGWESLILIPLLQLLATIITGIALLTPRKPRS